MNASKCSLIDHPVFPQWEGRVVMPVEKPVVHEEKIVVGPGLENFLLNFGFPVLVPRLCSELEKWVLVSSGDLKRGKYDFDYISPGATLKTRPLDNPPRCIADPGSCPTTIEQAFASMDQVWSDKKLAPLDWFSFALLINSQDCGEAFRDQMVKQYRAYNKVLVLFSDILSVGESTKRLYLVWELVLYKEKIKSMSFSFVEGNFTCYLAHKETIVSVCVSQDAVIAETYADGLIPSEAVPLCLGVDSSPSPRTPMLTPLSRCPTLKQMVADPDWRTTYGCHEEELLLEKHR